MIRKSMCILQILLTLGGCSGPYVRNTFTILPHSEDELRRFHEEIHGKELRLLRLGEEATSIRDLRVTPDSTTYLVRRAWRPSSTAFDSYSGHTVPTSTILSVSSCSERPTTSYTLIGAAIGGVLSMALICGLAAILASSIGEDDGGIRLKPKQLAIMFLPGALLGGSVGMYLGETAAEWDEYRFDHGS